MDRYLCQLCNKTVPFGENHQCLFYKNGDNLYSLPEPDELNEIHAKHDEEDKIATNAIYYSEKLHPEIQQTKNEKDEQLNSLLPKNNEQALFQHVSKRKRKYLSMSDETFDNTQFENSRDASISGSALNLPKNAAHSTECAIASFNVSSEKPACTAKEKYGKIDLVHSQKIEVPLLRSASSPQVASKVSENNLVNDFVNNGEDLVSVNDADPLEGTSIMNVHAQRHSEDKRFICRECKKRYRRKDRFEAHIRSHTGERPFLCDRCDKRFFSRGNLISHLLTHTKVKPFACDVCGERFTTNNCLSMHSKTHSAERPHACDVCEKRFSSKNELKTHYRTHTGDKPYKCPICGKDFADSSNRNKHQKIHTKK